MRVLSVVGNQPQFIKAAPLSAAFREAQIDEVVLHTGQHYDRELSQVFFEELALEEPRYQLDLQTADVAVMLPAIRTAVEAERPDWVLVYGDTNSTLAGAHAAGTVPVAHVEAGLRSFDTSMPEERNRVDVDHLARLLFCPDDRSARQLEREGAPGEIEVVGDVMVDAIRLFGAISSRRGQILSRLGVTRGQYLVVTIHREANMQPERLRRIIEGLDRLVEPIVFPVHPRTRAALAAIGARGIELIDPVGYLDFNALIAGARVVLTDSGGVQKEAYWHRVPCVTLRANTEWVDTVLAGANVLVDDDPDAIVASAAAARFPSNAPELYGDGHAAGRIAAALYARRP